MHAWHEGFRRVEEGNRKEGRKDRKSESLTPPQLLLLLRLQNEMHMALQRGLPEAGRDTG